MSTVRYHSHVPGETVSCPMPEIHEVHLEDVVHALSQVCRFGGWEKSFSVLQHSLEVAILCQSEAPRFGVDPDNAFLAGALHDAHETYVGDMITPLKTLLGEAWYRVERECERRVHAALGVTRLMHDMREIVAWADREMLASDMARWGRGGTVSDLAGNVTTVEPMRVQPPFVLRFPYAACWPAEDVRHFFCHHFHQVRSRVVGDTGLTIDEAIALSHTETPSS